MFRRDFPDIVELKQKISSNFRRGEGWPSVVLNVDSGFQHRAGIQGPLSLFVNLRGSSSCAVGRRAVNIHDGAYFLTNQGDVYTLHIDEAEEKTETMNIHFGDRFAAEILHSLMNSDDQLLDRPFENPKEVPHFFSHLYSKTDELLKMLYALRNSQRQFPSAAKLEEDLTVILSWLLAQHRKELKRAGQIPALKKSTREECWKRLSAATDWMQSHHHQPSLAELAEIASLSKFHFLRLFRAAYGKTPHDYFWSLQMERASRMLVNGMNITEVSLMLGFSETSSFSRKFKQHFGEAPSAWQKTKNKSAIFVNCGIAEAV